MIRLYWNKFVEWYRENWLKVFKFVLTILRNLLFIGFIVFYFYKNANLTNNDQINFPTICFFAMLVYNWRFVLTILILFVGFPICLMIYLFFVLILCIFWNVSSCAHDLYEKASKIVNWPFILIKKLWSEFDWQCCHNFKNHMLVLDTIRYSIYAISVIVIFLFELVRLESDLDLLLFYLGNLVLFLFNILIEIYRIVEKKRDYKTIHDLFPPKKKCSRKLRTWIREHEMNSLRCTSWGKCLSLNTEHRALAHPKELFKIKFKDVAYNKWGANLVIGFHQTSIKNARSIMTGAFRPSIRGMLGPGIYFANNYDATERKRNPQTPGGAIFCALIDMGRVYEMERISESHLSQTHNSKYLHHGGGKIKDEFVIYEESQILEYTVIVETEAILNYRRTHA